MGGLLMNDARARMQEGRINNCSFTCWLSSSAQDEIHVAIIGFMVAASSTVET